MSLPNSARAIIDPRKVRDYLLSEGHPVGRFKAALFLVLGYSAAQWEMLHDDLLSIARTGPAARGHPSAYGQTFEVDGILTGPAGRSAAFRTVWMIKTGEDFPRFITARPR